MKRTNRARRRYLLECARDMLRDPYTPKLTEAREIGRRWAEAWPEMVALFKRVGEDLKYPVRDRIQAARWLADRAYPPET